MSALKTELLCLSGLLLCSCDSTRQSGIEFPSHSNPTNATPAGATGTEMTREEALKLVSSIKMNMTFTEIAQKIPLSTNITPSLISHGGVVYTVSVRGYFIQLRFEHPVGSSNPRGGVGIEACALNYPPMLKQARDGPILNVEGLAPVNTKSKWWRVRPE